LSLLSMLHGGSGTPADSGASYAATAVMRPSLGIVSMLVLVACSESMTSPVAARTRLSARTLADTTPPFATGVTVDTVPVGSDYTYFGGINDFGEVAIAGADASGNAQGARWSPGQPTTYLAFPDPFDNLYNVNDEGEAVLSWNTPFSSTVAIWERSGEVRVLPVLFPDSASGCYAIDINSARTALGSCQPRGGAVYPTVWINEGQPQMLRADNGDSLVNTGPQHISTNGTIALQTARGAAVLTPTHHLRHLLGFAGGGAAVLDANDGGWASGEADNGTCTVAVAWTPADSLLSLGICGAGMWINDADIVVGQAYANNNGFAYVWTRKTGARRLPRLIPSDSGETSIATAINQRNQILGYTIDQINGAYVFYTVVWTLSPSYGR
jgi:hypothetical protein